MIMIKLLAVLMISSSVASSSVAHRINDIKQAQPASYDLKVSWYYNSSEGRNGLWAYTPSGGGITQEVLFTYETTHWLGYVPNSFFASEFDWYLWIQSSPLNDDLFTLVSGTTYRYNSPDYNTISYYLPYGGTYTRIKFIVNDSSYYVRYTMSVNERLPAFSFVGNMVYRHPDTNVSVGVDYLPNTSSYTFVSSYAVSSYVIMYPNVPDGTLITAYDAIYAQLVLTTNIEGQDWWDIYNEGVNAGYDAGLNDGYNDGVIDGQLDNTGWQDAFIIVKGAIDTVSNVLAIKLFGFFTIGTLVSIPIVVGLLFWIIEKWRGS